MRIHAVRLRNLNSLAGTWVIDFTAPEYTASGIFAITGPTGAGKSTILDAICLALFARTPRLGHISKGSNEIMSRRTGDCFAEVEFETRRGRFRCHWAQHRARRSPEGELQPPRHEMVDATNGKVLESRSKEVGRLVEQVTGMDFDRFTRSILLAQGEFAAFLEADADQRAPILEQITGTAIYSRISMAVHERTSEERRKTELIAETMGSVSLLSCDEEQALTAAINEQMATVTARQRQLAELSQALHRIATIESLQVQLAETERLLLELTRRRDEDKEVFLRLERGLRAQSLLGDHNRLTETEGRLTGLRAKNESLRASLEQLRGQQRQRAEELALAGLQREEQATLQQREQETITTVRALDLRIHEKRKHLSQATAAHRQTAQERERLHQQRQELDKQLIETDARQQQLDAFFRAHGNDSLLVEQLAGYRQQLNQLGGKEQGLERMEQRLRELRTSRTATQEQMARLGDEEARATQTLTVLRQRLRLLETQRDDLLAGQPLAEWRQQVEAEELRLRQVEKAAELLHQQQRLDMEAAALDRLLRDTQVRIEREKHELRALEDKRSLQQQVVAQCERNQQLALRIRGYEQERSRLVEGLACPLCGATHHPFAEHGVEEAIIGDEPVAEARAALERMTTDIGQRREKLIGLDKDSEHGQLALNRVRQQRLELEATLTPLLPLLGQTEDRSAGATRTLAQGRERIAALRDRLRAVEDRESELQRLRAQLEQHTVQSSELQQQVQTARHALTTIDQDLFHLEGQRDEERAWIADCRRILRDHLRPLGIDDCPPGHGHSLLLHLETRLRNWKAQQEQMDRLTRLRSNLQTERDKLDLLLTTTIDRLAQQEGELERMRREQAGLLAERFELYGDRDPTMEEQRLKTLVQQAEAKEQGIRNQLIEVERELYGQGEQLRLNSEELDTLGPRVRELKTGLLARLVEAGFIDRDDVLGSLLADEELAELDKHRQTLDREQTMLTARLTEQRAALAREQALRDERRQEELEAAQAAGQQELEALHQRIGADRERLAVNARLKLQFEAQQQVLAAQHRELERWELLHQLIGSADGKKFRVFAQGLTFEVMISHANRQLRTMSDRYILLRDPKEPLALQVLDNYQAGEIRSTRNLSGGESFLVSLALSLGLSAMASHNVQVDSLFLDEGFGTLDEEALDAALQTLAELRQDGKLIGIISHVPMLRERIDARIQVLPGPGGRSRLRGPGCAQLG